MIPAKIQDTFIQLTTNFNGLIIEISAGNFLKSIFKPNNSIFSVTDFLEGTLEALELNTSILLEGMLIVYNNNEYNVSVELFKSDSDVTVLIHDRTTDYKHISQLNQQRNDLFFLKRAITEKNKELKRLREIADKANEDKSRFLAMMSHEIRNPLNVILGYAAMISEEAITDKVAEYTNLLSISGEHLKVIVNDILDLSRIEAGRLELVNSPINLIEIAQNSIENFRYQNTNKEVSLVLHKPVLPKDTFTVLGDDVRLYQIFSNLLSNALKFTTKGSISIALSVASETSKSVQVVFDVTDSGAGMTEEQATKIFEEYQQNNSSDYRVLGGAGLGLSIVSRLLSAMGGSISVKSKLHVGSTFTFKIPFKKVNESNAVKHDLIEKNNFSNKSLSGKRVLVADDDVLNQTIVAHILKKEKVDFVQVKDGLSALHSLQKEVFDVLLLDIHMPNITGEELVSLKSDFLEKNKKIPIIALTANTSKEDVERYLSVGFTEVVGKPYNAATLLEKIKRSCYSFS